MELERTVADAAQQLLGDEPAIAAAVEEAGLAASEIPLVLERIWKQKLQSEAEAASALGALVTRVELRREGMLLSIMVPMPVDQGGHAPPRSDAIITRFIPMRMKRRGRELRLVIEGPRTAAPKVDLVLLKALARARWWFDELASGRTASICALAARERVSARYVGRLIRLEFLAPSIVELIADGRQAPDLTVEMMTRRTVLPLDWDAQKTLLGIGERAG